MYHVGIERLIVETGYYPNQELSYNGGFQHFYVPAYRLFVSSLALVTDVDPMLMTGLITILTSLAIFGIIYAMAKRGLNSYAGICALFLLVLSPELTIFTIRGIPEILGLFMLPLTLYFVVINRSTEPFKFNTWSYLSIAAAAITALTHQMTLLTLALILLIYMLTQIKNRAELFNALIPLAAAIAVYAIWQLYSLQTISILGLSQVKFHEGLPVDFFASEYRVGFIERAGILPIPFTIIGIIYLEFKKIDKRFLLYAWIVASLILTKNDLFGISVFMDRFLTFLVEAMLVLGGIGIFVMLETIDKYVFRKSIYRQTSGTTVQE